MTAHSYRGPWLWLTPLSVIGGMIAATHGSATAIPWPRLAAGLALASGGWLMFWDALLVTDWSPLRTWGAWQAEAPLPRWPYLQPQTPGDALYHTVARAYAWWQEQGRAALWHPLRQALVAGASSLLLGWSLGRTALLLTLLLLAWAELAALWHEGQTPPGSGWMAVAWVGLPWLLGGTLIGLTPTIVNAALVLTLLAAGYASPTFWTVVGPLGAVAFLLTQHHPIAAGSLLLLSYPGLLLRLTRPSLMAYRSAVIPWLLAMLLIVASVL